VRADRGCRAFKHGLLDVQALGHRLDDDIARAEPVEIEIPGGRLDRPDGVAGGDGGRMQALQTIDRPPGPGPGIVRPFLREFEQQNRDARIRELGRDLRTDDAGAENGGASDSAAGLDHVLDREDAVFFAAAPPPAPPSLAVFLAAFFLAAAFLRPVAFFFDAAFFFPVADAPGGN